MHCDSCAKLIEGTLSKLDGVESVSVSYPDESAKVSFDSEKVSFGRLMEEIAELGYSAGDSPSSSRKKTLKQGIIYGLVPHIGCIGFIVASILGVTVAIELFRPLLMNPWFFHILVAISIGFATITSAFYLRKQGILSLKGIARKKKYLASMYGSTVGINLVLFLVIFPITANFDTGSFANAATGAVVLDGADSGLTGSVLTLQVDIPCPGHAPLISGELKTIEGVTGVRFNFPNYFDVAFDPEITSKEEMLSLEVFETYKPTVVSEPEENIANFEEIKEVGSLSQDSAPAGSCGGSCGGSSCGGSASASASTPEPSCGCGG